ncbi:MAG: hypothetical protein IRY99_19780 [Isosphaeraceae bacterium]|nr:hypothetical protein [Isosphaeraceae bacterium]
MTADFPTMMRPLGRDARRPGDDEAAIPPAAPARRDASSEWLPDRALANLALLYGGSRHPLARREPAPPERGR